MVLRGVGKVALCKYSIFIKNNGGLQDIVTMNCALQIVVGLMKPQLFTVRSFHLNFFDYMYVGWRT